MAVDRNGNTVLKRCLDIFRVVWCKCLRSRPLEYLFRWLITRIFQLTAFDRTSPNVFVDTPNLFGALPDGRTHFKCIFDFLTARPVLFANGREYRNSGQMHPQAEFNPKLVIALSGAAMHYRVVGAARQGILRSLLGNQRSCDCGGKRVS